MTLVQATTIGEEFVNHWNNFSEEEHHLIYDENVELTCSLANRIITETCGKICGRETLIEYWQLIKNKYPNYKVILHHSSMHNNNLVIYCSIPPFSTNVCGLITFNSMNKITKVKLSHV